MNLDTRAAGVLGGGEDLAADFFREVGHPANGAHFRWDGL
jgi:hypothetical protein